MAGQLEDILNHHPGSRGLIYQAIVSVVCSVV